MDDLYIIKIGGNIIDEQNDLASFLKLFSNISGKKILVHGGGKLATRMAEKLSVPQKMIDGRRVTDADTLDVITMVYAGLVNKKIVSKLQALGCNAAGFTGADGNSILSHKRVNASVEYGFVGDVDNVDPLFFKTLLDINIVPVMAPLTHDGKGNLLNTNADTIAQEIAKSLSEFYRVSLIYSFEKSGVLRDVADESSLISILKKEQYQQLKDDKKVHSGMIPKLDNAFAATDAGVAKVIIGNAMQLDKLITGKTGTSISND